MSNIVPDGVSLGQIITSVAEVRAAWGDNFIIEDDPEIEPTVSFGNDPRVVYTHDAIYVRVSRAIVMGPRAELSEWVKIEEPTVGAMKATERVTGDVSKAAALLAAMTGAPNIEVEKLKASDMNRIGSILGNFY